MTTENGLAMLEKYDGDGKTLWQHIEYLVSKGATRKEAEAILIAFLKDRIPPSYNEDGSFNEIDPPLKRKS